MIKELRDRGFRPHAVVFERKSQAGGWVCTIGFSVTTANQFADEYDCGSGYSKWWWLAWWRARRGAKALYRQLRAKPGERSAKGWN